MYLLILGEGGGDVGFYLLVYGILHCIGRYFQGLYILWRALNFNNITNAYCGPYLSSIPRFYNSLI